MKSEKNQVTYTVRLEKSVSDIIERACDQACVTKSDFLRAALAIGLSRASVITIINRAKRNARNG